MHIESTFHIVSKGSLWNVICNLHHMSSHIFLSAINLHLKMCSRLIVIVITVLCNGFSYHVSLFIFIHFIRDGLCFTIWQNISNRFPLFLECFSCFCNKVPTDILLVLHLVTEGKYQPMVSIIHSDSPHFDIWRRINQIQTTIRQTQVIWSLYDEVIPLLDFISCHIGKWEFTWIFQFHRSIIWTMNSFSLASCRCYSNLQVVYFDFTRNIIYRLCFTHRRKHHQE